MIPGLTAERAGFVVTEHARLLRKLQRMPAAHRKLAVARLPDIASGETIADVVRPQVPSQVAALMEAIGALEPERKRIVELYFQVLSVGEEAALAAARLKGGPLEADLTAVLEARDEIERANPRLKRVRDGLERQRGVGTRRRPPKTGR